MQDPQAKVVLFSQWLGTHELVSAALAARGIGYVLFHGGIATDERGALVDRFRDDAACRVFLSTDAGGVGLNLQHAAVIINMDLPWNPAVLEQRIGRVHRYGQKRNVLVLNFVAEASIEAGILDLIRFKRALFEGVLDGGEGEIQQHGSAMQRFMHGVETLVRGTDDTLPDAAYFDEDGESGLNAPGALDIAAAAIEPATTPDIAPASATAALGPVGAAPELPAASGDAAAGPASDLVSVPEMSDAETQGSLATLPPEPSLAGSAAAPLTHPAGPQGGASPWQPLLELGLQVLGQLTAPPPGAAAASQGNPVPRLVERDPATGKTYLRIPAPEPDTVRQLAQALQALLLPPGKP
ncbi:MAG: hypothetical protein JNM98_07415 [Rhodocyclaceae bacterium]|nr:hypothetical protein [Rhodocyclaceae bacterium]